MKEKVKEKQHAYSVTVGSGLNEEKEDNKACINCKNRSKETSSKEQRL